MSSIVLTIIILIIAFGICFLLVYRHYATLLDVAVKRAQKSEQLKAVFIENISRTLHSPLKSITDSCNTILEGKDEDLKPALVKKTLADIYVNLKETTDYVSQLHEMSKFEGITPSFTFIEVNLSELMASYRREAMNYTKPEVSVRVTTDLSPHCRAVLDTNLMHQLMMHLLTDAAHHVTQGDIFIRYSCERRGLHVSISYTGMGQAELEGDDIYSILQKDEALKDAVKSPLFRQAICRAIVDMFGGEFYMDSEDNKKTVSSFWFPCKMVDVYKGV